MALLMGVLAAPVGAGDTVELCHFTTVMENNISAGHVITVSVRAEAAHRAHGDNAGDWFFDSVGGVNCAYVGGS